MERTIVAQTKDEYPFKMFYDLERRFNNNQHHDRSNAQYCDAYVTEWEVDAAAGIHRVHPSLIEYAIEQDKTLKGTAFSAMGKAQQDAMEESVINRMNAYDILMGASRNNVKLITNTQNDYAQGMHRCAPDLPKQLKIMDGYSKTNIVVPIPNQGSYFAQSGRGRGQGDDRAQGWRRARGWTGKITDRSDKDWAKDKTCGRCGEVGHVARMCPNNLPKSKKKSSDDDRSKSSKSSHSLARSNQKEISKIKPKLKASFAQIKEARNTIDKLEDESLTDSDDESGSQFLMIGEHIMESTSGHEDESIYAEWWNHRWLSPSRVLLPLQDYEARGIFPPMWKIWLEKDLNEPVCKEETTTLKPLWCDYTRYLFHRNSERKDINTIVNEPYDASGLTIQEAHYDAS
jgi:hypothetical protein